MEVDDGDRVEMSVEVKGKIFVFMVKVLIFLNLFTFCS